MAKDNNLNGLQKNTDTFIKDVFKAVESSKVLDDPQHELKDMLEEELTDLLNWLKTGEISPREVLLSLGDLVESYKPPAE